MSVSLRKQDLPPAGGYAPIITKRIPPKSYLNGFAIFGLYLGVTAVGFGVYGYTYFVRKREEIEMRSARLAFVPMLIAERDREFLKQIRKNRDAERDLMKNVEGWKLGTYYGEPIYKTLPADSVHVPIDGEFYVHASASDWRKLVPTFALALLGNCAVVCYLLRNMEHVKNFGVTEMCLRKKITGEVICEVLEQRRQRLIEERRERENELQESSDNLQQLLQQLQSKHPLYESHASSIYVERYGSSKKQPFRKCTKFSKPIYEQFEGPFKPE